MILECDFKSWCGFYVAFGFCKVSLCRFGLNGFLVVGWLWVLIYFVFDILACLSWCSL